LFLGSVVYRVFEKIIQKQRVPPRKPLGCEINIFVALSPQKSKIQRKDPKVEKSTLPPFLFVE
jgi:hypothetical protein